MLHIAVCDDNVADRKQTERLLGRETAKWVEIGDTLYSDSFGNAESMLGSPMSFDAFFIDICHTEGLDAITVVRRLREKGVNVPMVLVCSEVNYREQAFDAGTIFINKPINPTELHDLLLELREKKNSLEKLIELRGELDTLYVTSKEILYAESLGSNVKVTLTDERSRTIRCDIISFFDNVAPSHACFIMPNTSAVLNIDHIIKIRFRNAHMSDGNTFGIHGDVLKYIKHYQSIKAEE